MDADMFFFMVGSLVGALSVACLTNGYIVERRMQYRAAMHRKASENRALMLALYAANQDRMRLRQLYSREITQEFIEGEFVGIA